MKSSSEVFEWLSEINHKMGFDKWRHIFLEKKIHRHWAVLLILIQYTVELLYRDRETFYDNCGKRSF